MKPAALLMLLAGCVHLEGRTATTKAVHVGAGWDFNINHGPTKVAPFLDVGRSPTGKLTMGPGLLIEHGLTPQWRPTLHDFMRVTLEHSMQDADELSIAVGMSLVKLTPGRPLLRRSLGLGVAYTLTRDGDRFVDFFGLELYGSITLDPAYRYNYE